MGKKDIIGVIEGDDKDNYSTSAIKNKITRWHLVGGAVTDHATLCGLDGYDEACGQFGIVKHKPGQKVDCDECINEFLHVKSMNITVKDFKT